MTASKSTIPLSKTLELIETDRGIYEPKISTRNSPT